MTEYIIIVFLIGIGTIALITLYGDNVRLLFGSSAASLAGQADVENGGSSGADPKWTLKGGATNPYETGSCGVSGCSSNGP
jgi:hypothetical protein